MNTPFATIPLCACLLWLGACDKTTPVPPTPVVNKSVPFESAAASGPVADPSLPSADSVFSPATAADATLGRPDGTRKPAQESIATPIPGQNNDHSAPLGPAQRASAP